MPDKTAFERLVDVVAYLAPVDGWAGEELRQIRVQYEAERRPTCSGIPQPDKPTPEATVKRASERVQSWPTWKREGTLYRAEPQPPAQEPTVAAKMQEPICNECGAPESTHNIQSHECGISVTCPEKAAQEPSDTEIVNWLERGECEPMRVWHIDRFRWCYMGIYYDTLREAVKVPIHAAMKGSK